jgi:hypothetical protein
MHVMSGIVPEMLFEETSSQVSAAMPHSMACDRDPLSVLADSMSVFSAVRLLNEAGRLPVSALLSRYSAVSPVMLLSSGGSVPLRLVLDALNHTMLLSAPHEAGSEPLSCVLDKLRYVSAVNGTNNAGSITRPELPTKLMEVMLSSAASATKLAGKVPVIMLEVSESSAPGPNAETTPVTAWLHLSVLSTLKLQ